MGEAGIQVKVERISTVTLAVPSFRQRMFLSKLDFLWLPFKKPQRLLFYKVIFTTEENSSMAERLKRSLSSVLVYFYPFTGRLDIGESGRPEIDCNDSGVEFIEASINIPFDDLEKEGFQHKPFFENLVEMAHPSQQLHENYNTPLLSIQVTAFEGGGICIGCAFNHVVADGNSFWHFMKSWAECSRGLPVSKPPHHMRTIFNREQKTPMAISYKPHETVNDRISGAYIYKFLPETEPEHIKAISMARDSEMVEEILADHKTEAMYSTFCFTKEMIAGLKERSGASTSFVAVAAQFWRCVIKAQEIAEEENVHFLVLGDSRGRVKPPFPPTYFGNCISLGFAKTTAKKLVNEDVCFAAGVIQELINISTADEQLYNMIEWFQSRERGVVDLICEIGCHYITNVVSSHRFPVYEIDFAWGRPLNAQRPSMNEIGAMFLDAPKEGGGILVSTRLPHHHMLALNRLLFLDIH